MQVCKFPGAREIGKPREWDDALDGECGTIYVTDQIETLSGQNMMYSVYKPTEADLEAFANGGVLRLGIMGRAHPVFQMAVLDGALAERAEVEAVWDMGPVIC